MVWVSVCGAVDVAAGECMHGACLMAVVFGGGAVGEVKKTNRLSLV